MPFLNIVNEWFLRDCSRKQCAAYQVRGNAGKPTTNHAIYGYRKKPRDKHRWLIDEEAAAVVRRIFYLSMEGHGPHKIASILRDGRIERPSVYMGKRGQGTQRNSYDDCQRQSEIVRKRRRNFVVFRRKGGQQNQAFPWSNRVFTICCFWRINSLRSFRR